MLKRLSLGLAVMFLVMGLLLLFASCRRGSESLAMVTLKHRHTYVYTSALETFSIDVLANTGSHALMLEEGVRDVVMISKTETTRIPLMLARIDYNGSVAYDDNKMDWVTYQLRVALTSEAGTVNIPDAALQITSVHGERITLPIGTFNYYFGLDEPQRVNVIGRHNLHKMRDGLPTSKGIVLEIENVTDEAVELIEIGMNDQHATFDIGSLVTVENHPEAYTDCVTLFQEACDVNRLPTRLDEPFMLEPFARVRIALPLALADDYGIVHRYPIVIKTDVGGVLTTDVFDDFPFIRTNPFKTVSIHHETVELDED